MIQKSDQIFCTPKTKKTNQKQTNKKQAKKINQIKLQKTKSLILLLQALGTQIQNGK